MNAFKNSCFASLLLIGLFSSCNKDDTIAILQDDESMNISVTRVNSLNTLKFKDKRTFENFVREINNKDESEKLLFGLKHQIESPLRMMKEAEDELEGIFNSYDESELNNFIAEYNLFKEKYSNNFLFNDIGEELDFSPYSKFINSELEAIINLDGYYIIGDSLVQAPSYNNINELMNSRISDTRATTSTTPNYAIGSSKNRRCEMWMSNTGSDIYVRFVGKRKYWVGWLKNNMSFIAEYKLAAGSPPLSYFEFYESPYFGYPYEAYRNLDNVTFRIITKEYKDLTVHFGRINFRVPILPSLHGTMEIWSSELNYSDRGIASVDLYY